MGKIYKFFFILLFIAILIGFVWLMPTTAQALFFSKTISVQQTYAVPSPTPSWNLLEKINEGDDPLLFMPLVVGTKSYSFTEQRGNPLNRTTKKFDEPDREIGLKLFNTQTGGFEYIKILFHAGAIVAPPGWNIQMLERTNGIKWNYWNTAYQVISPENYIVLKNKFPNIKKEAVVKKIKDKKGRVIGEKIIKPAEVEYITYVPYSPDLQTPELTMIGHQYLEKIVQDALASLRGNGVFSKAVPGVWVADVPELPASFFSHLPLLEQADYTEFMIDPQNTVDRVKVIIGTNDKNAYAPTCSTQSACGLFQFTKPTYSALIKAYPSAHLIPNFETGSRDHFNSAIAAILLYDYNLAGLVKSYGDNVLKDPRLEEYLAAAYNGKPARVTNSLRASIKAGISDWVDALLPKKGGLATETKGYMVKLRYLQEQDTK